MKKLTSIATDFIAFINNVAVPVIFAIAFIVFLWGVFTYFIRGADNEEKRAQGRQFVMYSLVGFFVMISVWGLVNLLVNTFGFDSNSRPCLPTFGKDANCSSSGSGSTGSYTLPSDVYDQAQVEKAQLDAGGATYTAQ